MKKKLLILLVISAFISVNKIQGQPICPDNLDNQIDLKPFAKSRVSVRKAKRSFLHNYASVSTDMSGVKSTYGFGRKNAILKIDTNSIRILTGKGKMTSKCEIKALRILYGLDNNSNIILMFNPIVLTYKYETSDSIFFSFDKNPADTFWVFSNGKWADSTNSAPTLMLNYANNIQKKINNAWTNITINPALSNLSDPMGVTIPMIELTSLVSNNSVNGDNFLNKLSSIHFPIKKVFFISNAITDTVANNEATTLVLKHSIGIYPNLSILPSTNVNGGALIGMAADKVSKCPPNCPGPDQAIGWPIIQGQ